MPTIDIAGQSLEYRTIAGAAGRPWLVFLHEGLGSVSLWRDFPDRVASRLSLPALVYSRRGYGRSAPLDGPREVDFMHSEALDVLPELLHTLGIERCIPVGHSDGASIALIYAAAHADTVPGIVLMAPHVFVEPISVASITAITETYRAGDLRARLARHHDHVDDAFLGWSEIWRDPRFLAWSLLDECRGLTMPALLIQGENDEYGTLAQIEAIAREAPGPVRQCVLADCGHAPQRDQPQRVLDAISEFVGALADA